MKISDDFSKKSIDSVRALKFNFRFFIYFEFRETRHSHGHTWHRRFQLRTKVRISFLRFFNWHNDTHVHARTSLDSRFENFEK